MFYYPIADGKLRKKIESIDKDVDKIVSDLQNKIVEDVLIKIIESKGEHLSKESTMKINHLINNIDQVDHQIHTDHHTILELTHRIDHVDHQMHKDQQIILELTRRVAELEKQQKLNDALKKSYCTIL